VDIRNGEPRDADAIERISRASFDRVYAFFAIHGVRRAWPLLVAEEDGSVAGFLEGKLFDGHPPIGYIYYVAVDPTQRRRGIARDLIGEALAVFEHRGATRVFAAVSPENDASMAMLASLGFHEVDRQALWPWYGWRGLWARMWMVLAPFETLLVREAREHFRPSLPRAPP